jgi:enamine deaminase RidA (YjgF/YER057c/UK114 family)
MIERIEKTKIMHRIVKANGMIYLGGLVADDFTLDMKGQTRQICTKLDALLEKAGSSRERIVSAQLFVTDMAAKDAMNEAWTEWLDPEHLPARATIGVATLGGPNVLIEAVVTAMA